MSETALLDLFRQMAAGDHDAAWREFLDSYSPLILSVVRQFERTEDRQADGFLFVCDRLSADRSRRLRQYDPSAPASFTGWLATVVRHLCIDWLRQKFGRRRVFRALERRPALDQEIFRSVYFDGRSIRTTCYRLKPDYPGLTEERVGDLLEELHHLLTSRHLWLLSQSPMRTPELGTSADAVVAAGLDPENSAVKLEQGEALTAALATLEPDERLLVQLRYEQDLTLEQVARIVGLNTPGAADRRIRSVLTKLRESLVSSVGSSTRKMTPVSVEQNDN